MVVLGDFPLFPVCSSVHLAGNLSPDLSVPVLSLTGRGRLQIMKSVRQGRVLSLRPMANLLLVCARTQNYLSSGAVGMVHSCCAHTTPEFRLVTFCSNTQVTPVQSLYPEQAQPLLQTLLLWEADHVEMATNEKWRGCTRARMCP